MLRKILVPLDGSMLAESALPLAERLLRAGDAGLVLVRAAAVVRLPGSRRTDEEVQALRQAESYLESIAVRLRARGIAAEMAVPYGTAATSILEEIDIRKADLVVMATHGRSGLGRWFYGSVAEAVLGRSPVPVLLVRAWRGETEPPPTTGPKRLLVPLDGSLFAEAALPVAQELADLLDLELVLLRAVPPPQVERAQNGWTVAPLGGEQDALEAAAQGYLLGVRDRLARERPGSEPQIDTRVAAPADAIVTASIEHAAELVVMATHGRTGLPRVLLGSVAGGVVRQGSIPLLLVRPRALPPAPSRLIPPSEETVKRGPPMTVTLTQDEVALVRTALETLSQSVTRHEHLHGRIHDLLDRLAADEAVPVAN